jgi:glucokinase
VFYTTMGSGVGAGFVMDQHVYHGAKVTEAEFGHIRIDKSGRTVESSCSGWAVDQKIRAYVASDSTSILSEFTREYSRGEARALPAALKAGDQAAMQIVDETADDFAFALSHAVHLLNPDTVILGGGLSLIGEPLRIEIERKLSGYLMDVLRPGPLIQLSALKEDAVPIGALCLAIHKLKS